VPLPHCGKYSVVFVVLELDEDVLEELALVLVVVAVDVLVDVLVDEVESVGAETDGAS